MENERKYTDLLQMDPMELFDYLSKEFTVQIPISIETVEDLNNAEMLLGKCAANYSYLQAQALMAKLIKRNLKAEKASKAEIDTALSREEVLTTFSDITKVTYNAISRMITVRSQASEEMRMLGHN